MKLLNIKKTDLIPTELNQINFTYSLYRQTKNIALVLAGFQLKETIKVSFTKLIKCIAESNVHSRESK